MRRLKIRPNAVELLGRLAQKGYVIENGKATRALTYALKQAKVEVANASIPDTRRVILALEREIRITPRKRTSKYAFFDLE